MCPCVSPGSTSLSPPVVESTIDFMRAQRMNPLELVDAEENARFLAFLAAARAMEHPNRAIHLGPTEEVCPECGSALITERRTTRGHIVDIQLIREHINVVIRKCDACKIVYRCVKWKKTGKRTGPRCCFSSCPFLMCLDALPVADFETHFCTINTNNATY